MSGKFKWDKKYLYWGITAFLVIIGSVFFYVLLSKLTGASSVLHKVGNSLAPFVYGLVFAYLMIKLLNIFEDGFLNKFGTKLYPKNARKASKASRMLGILLTLLCFFIVVGGMLWLILPQIYSSLRSFVIDSPTYYKRGVEWINKFLEDNPALESTVLGVFDSVSEKVTSWLQTGVLPKAEQIVSNITSGVISIVREVLYILIGIVISVYVMYHKETFAAQAKKLTYSIFKTKAANKLIEGIRFIDKTCGGFIIGKIIDSLIIGIICYVVTVILRIPYAALVSVIVCVTNIIPVFGPFIGAIPSGLLILLESPYHCLVFVIFIIILQQVDGNIIGPKILGSSIGLSGFWIMFAILFFGGLFGFWGMLLGVPAFAVIYSAIKSLSQNRLRERDLPLDTEEYMEISYIDPITNTPVIKAPDRRTRVREQRKTMRRRRKDEKSESKDS